MEIAQGVALVVATVATGLVSGLFYGFAISVMPALHGGDDRTFIDVMQRINRAILNGWFLLGYVGALLFGALAVGLQFGGGDKDALWPAVAALVVYFASMGLTNRMNIPLNNALDAAGPVGSIARPEAVRAAFEGPWVRWNVVRALMCTAATGLWCWALVLQGGS
ncbi:anthrone oxygenase family protein [Streptomyces sp. WG-D5]